MAIGGLALGCRGPPQQLEHDISTPARRRTHYSKPHRSVPRPKPMSATDTALDAALDAAANKPARESKTFAQLGLAAPLVSALARRGISEPFAIQTRALPDGLTGRD